MDKNDASTVILVDGSSFLFRAFHALPALTNSRGEPTGAILGVANMLRKLLEQYASDHVIVVFDAPGKTFRNDLYPDYKANRPPAPQDLKSQIAPLHQLIRAMGLPLVIEEGVEADDVIGTLARQATEAGHRVIISTGDKDMAQLVNDKVILENTMNDTRMDREGVIEKFAVTPEQIIDYLALIGDTSDNIPGVPKVGPKTAAKWLAQYQTVDNLIENAGEIKGKVGENLRDSLQQIPLSRQLATIDCSVRLAQDLEALQPQPRDDAALLDMLQRFEFSSWLKQLDLGGDDTQQDAPERDYQVILEQQAFDDWLQRLEAAELFAFDTETTSLNYTRAEIVGVSFAINPHSAAYVPLAHDYPDAPQQLDRQKILSALQPLLENPDKAKVGQHLKYDRNVLRNHGITLQGIRHDTMLESYVLDSTATRHDMDSLALKYLGEQTIHFEDIAGKGAKQLCFSDIPLEQAGPYAAEDADITLRLHQHLTPLLHEHPPLEQLYSDTEIPLIPVLSDMECCGVLVDCEMLAKQSLELAERMQEIEQAAHQEAGEEFNLGSPKQIQSILYEKQGLPVLKKTPKGQPSTAESVLQDLALSYPLPRLILDHRSLSKLKSTYTDRLPEQINPKTGRIHTSYHQAVTATGRLSSSDPNLQNIPVRNTEGRRIRQAFIAPSGQLLMAADYSQIELRIMAHLSGDQGLLDAFNSGADIHRATAAEVFGTSLEQVSPEDRRSAKAINFGLIYGMSAFGLGQQLGIPRDKAQQYIDLYFSRYPGVREYMDNTRQLARDQGYVETLFGRRLYLPEINSRNGQRRQYAERTAINAPMQGTAADIIKRAMIATHRMLNETQLAARMIMQVHDELVFEVAEQASDELERAVRQCMTGAAELAIPLEVDIGFGCNWDEAH